MGLGAWLAPQRLAAEPAPAPATTSPRSWDWTDWAEVLAQSRAGAPVTRTKAMGLPGVGRGVRLIADVLGGINPDAIRYWDDQTRPMEVLPPPQVLADPDPSWHGPAVWTSAAVRDMELEGNALSDAAADTDRFGWPLSLPLIPPRCVTWEDSRRNGGGKVYAVTDPGTGQRREVRPGDMFHAAVDVDSGQRMGRGILHTYQDELRLIAAVERATYVVMRDGKPAGIISVDVDMTTDELKEHKAAFIAGVRADGIAALTRSEFAQVSWNAADLALIPAREHNLRLAADIVGLPPYLLGVPSESRVYSNNEAEWTNFVRTAAGRYLNPLQDALTRKAVPRGQTVRYNTDDLIRPDAKTRWEIHKIAKELGATTVAEIRQDERMGPMLPDTSPTTEEDDA